MEIVKEITFEFARVQLLASKIIRVEMFDDFTIDYAEAKKINDSIGELSNHQEIPVMMVAQSTTHFTHEARDFSASNEGLKYTIADAMVVSNLAQKMLVSFYLKFNQPHKPSKAFNNEKEAEKWLFSFLK